MHKQFFSFPARASWQVSYAVRRWQHILLEQKGKAGPRGGDHVRLAGLHPAGPTEDRDQRAALGEEQEPRQGMLRLGHMWEGGWGRKGREGPARQRGRWTRCAFSLMPTPGKAPPKGTCSRQFSSVQPLTCVRLFATPWTAACQASLSITYSQSLLKLMSTESVMPSNHLTLCRPLLLPPSIFPSIRIFSKESVLRIRWPKDWSFTLSSNPSNEYSKRRCSL